MAHVLDLGLQDRGNLLAEKGDNAVDGPSDKRVLALHKTPELLFSEKGLENDSLVQHLESFGGSSFLDRVEVWKEDEWFSEALAILFHLFCVLVSSKDPSNALKFWNDLGSSLFSTPLGMRRNDEPKVLFVEKVCLPRLLLLFSFFHFFFLLIS